MSKSSARARRRAFHCRSDEEPVRSPARRCLAFRAFWLARDGMPRTGAAVALLGALFVNEAPLSIRRCECSFDLTDEN
jgi:hypothetical protein